jgi:RNA polymerase sigma-70 factor (ECF subfamily)
MKLATRMAERSPVRAEVLDFEKVVRQHQGMVFSIAYHFLHDRPLAEELAQDVFLKLHRNMNSLKSPAHVTFWLRKTTSHRCIDYARRRRHEPDISLENVPEPVAPAPQGDPMLSAALRKLVASIPEKPRLVVILRYEEDLEPEEIARALNMPVRTVKSHLQRALALLREKAARRLGEVKL